MPKRIPSLIALALLVASCSDSATATLTEAQAACASYNAIDSRERTVAIAREEDLLSGSYGETYTQNEIDGLKKSVHTKLSDIWGILSTYDNGAHVQDRMRKFLVSEGIEENVALFDETRSLSTKTDANLAAKIGNFCLSIDLLQDKNLLPSS